MTKITDLIRKDKEYGELLSAISRDFSATKPLPIAASGLCEGAMDAAYVSLLSDLNESALILCAEEKECVRICEMLCGFGLPAVFFQSRDLNLYNITASHEYEHERLKVLYKLLRGERQIVVTTPDGALGYTVPQAVLSAHSIRLDFDSRIDTATFARELVAAGYVRAEMVDAPGQFAMRGGIIDVFPPTFIAEGGEDGRVLPLRIELFGDEIDRIGVFDIETQRFLYHVDAVSFPPAREVLANKESLEKIRAAVSSHFAKSKNENACREMVSEVAAIDTCLENGDGDLKFADKYISVIYPERVCLFDYLDARTLVLVRHMSATNERLAAFERQIATTVTDLLEGGTIAAKYAEYACPVARYKKFLAENVTVYLDSLLQGLSDTRLAGLFTFRTKQLVSYAEKFDLLLEDIESYRGYMVAIVAENETSAKNICGLLGEKGYEAALFDGEFLPNKICVVYRECIGGFELTTARAAVLSVCPEIKRGSLSASARLRRKGSKRSATQTILSAADLQVGDYVVHDAYGIGIYEGIENLTVDGISHDYINIRYAGSDKLFLPVEKLDMVSKYIGARSEDGAVKLSKFGGGEWNRTKSKTKAAVKDIAKDLIKLYAERMRKEGIAFPADDDMQMDFENSFAYEETGAQLDAIADIKEDMEKSVPMDRLLCGDVGYGKTEVAFRAAYKAIMGGKQVAILVPTTILALQHYQTALSRMRAFGVEVDMISRFRTPKQIAQSLRKLARGETDFIIGTHRLLSSDVEFKDLGLLIVDEEQRFGVVQKEKIKQMAGNIDVLTLTATPIPRTLNMAMGGIRDISVLDEAPGDRVPVQTYVLEDDDLIIMEAIKRELRRGGQVFYMHNFVDSITTVAAKIAKAVPEARIRIAHGQMEKEMLEDIWNSMLTGETDVLVSTSIIETGIDIPNANTLIVDNAHRLGLSQLHQLRGRVGRSARRAYAYFTYPKNRALTEIAQKRLEAVRDYAEFGAGFKIAMRDLELRGAGNLLGSKQHGHLDAVGYDLYIKLLNEAVLEERGVAVKEEAECKVTVNYDAFLPESYVSSPSQRMHLYKRIALIRNRDDYYDLTDELVDRFGELPTPAKNLLEIALIRAGGIAIGVDAVEQEGSSIKIFPKHIDIEIWSELCDLFGGSIGIVMTGKTYINLYLRKAPEKLAKKPLALVNKIFEKYLEIGEML